ncbi:hypothetical protein N0V94_004920 [Neodidymelliopsis sp. IMI 364377]|nr:hypothetical protein N0V94_004920 [Neodidymelliopsis sp. IMI 364377]
MAETTPRVHKPRPGFGDNAPPKTIPFPKQAQFTAVELLAFFPNCIYSADVVYRLISNGGTRKAIHSIINTHRAMEAEWSANCCGENMYKTMEKAGYTKWTIKRHNIWHESRKDTWDGNKLDVGDLRAAPGVPAKSVSFENLAADVRTMPEGDDALDLTRMVQYCVRNLEDGWRYPEDYEELLELLGGPAEVQEDNTDGAVFLGPGIASIEEQRKSGRRENIPGSRLTSRSVGLESNSSYNLRTPRRSNRAVSKDAPDLEDEVASGAADEGHGTPYMREPAEYVAPPLGTKGTTAGPQLLQTFQAEGTVGESDPFSVYAFGGPRRIPPYRYLCDLTQPYPWDISGWAENLRWSFEQRTLFEQSFPEATGWTESPEHMAYIERQRTQRLWASDELLEQLLDDD